MKAFLKLLLLDFFPCTRAIPKDAPTASLGHPLKYVSIGMKMKVRKRFPLMWKDYLLSMIKEIKGQFYLMTPKPLCVSHSSPDHVTWICGGLNISVPLTRNWYLADKLLHVLTRSPPTIFMFTSLLSLNPVRAFYALCRLNIFQFTAAFSSRQGPLGWMMNWVAFISWGGQHRHLHTDPSA